MSGLSRTPGKRVWVYPHRGFESRPLRHEHVSLSLSKGKTSHHNPAMAGFVVSACQRLTEAASARPLTQGSSYAEAFGHCPVGHAAP